MPNQILEVVAQPDFCRDGSCLVEMVHKLVVVDDAMVNILSFQRPFKIKAGRTRIFIFHPTTFFQSFLYVRIPASANKNFGIFINPGFFLPSCQILNIRKNMFWLVSFQEIVNCLITSVNLALFGLFDSLLRIRRI